MSLLFERPLYGMYNILIINEKLVPGEDSSLELPANSAAQEQESADITTTPDRSLDIHELRLLYSSVSTGAVWAS
jgi:hypothetical protein